MRIMKMKFNLERLVINDDFVLWIFVLCCDILMIWNILKIWRMVNGLFVVFGKIRVMQYGIIVMMLMIFKNCFMNCRCLGVVQSFVLYFIVNVIMQMDLVIQNCLEYLFLYFIFLYCSVLIVEVIIFIKISIVEV